MEPPTFTASLSVIGELTKAFSSEAWRDILSNELLSSGTSCAGKGRRSKKYKMKYRVGGSFRKKEKPNGGLRDERCGPPAPSRVGFLTPLPREYHLFINKLTYDYT